MFNSQLSLVIVALCAACGSTFQAEGSGGSGTGGSGQAGDEAGGGKVGSGGAQNGGSAGEESSAGAAGEAGSRAGAGGASAGAGGSAAGAGGSHAGASGSTAGGSGANCDALKLEYKAIMEKARACDKGVVGQCSTTSTAPALGCGCPVLVNSKSEYTASAKKKYQAIQDAHCDSGPVCDIACFEYTSAACTAQSMASGSAYVCTGASGPVVN